MTATDSSRFDAVLFDFAGTLAVPKDAVDQLRLAAPLMADDDVVALAPRLTAAGLPGGPYPAAIPAPSATAYALRDTDGDTHRAAYESLISTVVEPSLARTLYELVRVPDGWLAYADAISVLDELRDRGVRTGVVTNVGFDLLPVARGLGLLERLDAWTSSADVGAAKPDPRIFEVAAAAVGASPTRCLMVGDHPEADAGAVSLGMATLLLPMSSPGAEHGLAAVLRLVATCDR